MMTSPRPTDNAPMIDHALWYASIGWAIMPLHEPLFDEAGNVCGCTCEAWKRENRDPEYVCPTPGKHPIHSSWEEKATTDVDQIRRWWRAWPTANIGLAVGKSGLLTLDLDAYKDAYDGGDLLTRSDEETITQLSGGGGAHLVYRLPEGKTWGNQRGDLPVGIDVRGCGGMQVVAPSLHPSGRRYQWELDYGPDEIQPLPVPDWLCNVLDAAQERSTAARAVHFDQADTERPDLAQWDLAGATVDAIHQPAPTGGRSEQDMRVIVALCYAGLTDDQIRAVFQHYPIGTRGKYAERGDRYLSHTIGKARAHVDANPSINPEAVRAEVAHLRAWVKSTSFAEYVPIELQSAVGYRTDATDTKVADAYLDLAEERGTFRILASVRNVRKRAGVGSTSTVTAARQRLAGWFLTVDEEGIVEIVARRSNGITQQGGDNTFDLRATYSERKGDDPFLTGVSHTVKAKISQDARRLSHLVVDEGAMTPAESAAVAWEKQLLAATEPGLGESILRMIDAIEIHGPSTRAELIESTGKTKSAVGRATLRAESLGLLIADQEHGRAPKVYSLASDWRDVLDRLSPHLKTHKLGLEREKRDCEAVIGHCDRKLKSADDEEQRKLASGKARAEKRLAEILPALYEDMTENDVDRWVVTPSASNAAFDHAPIMQEQRAQRVVHDMQTLSDLLQPGRVLWRDELARGRNAAGRVGVKFDDYVEDVPLAMAAD